MREVWDEKYFDAEPFYTKVSKEHLKSLYL